MAWLHAVEVRGARGPGQDCAAVIDLGDALVVVLADGAGGTGGGDVAADAIIAAVRATASSHPSWSDVIEELDRSPLLGGGQATAVIATLTAAGVRGASVGDSGAWLVRGAAVEDLTRAQERKPLVGSGAAATPFGCGPLDGATLLVASDGLLKYAPRADIARLASQDDLAAAARALVALVRLPGGDRQDDVSVILCRSR